MELRQLGTSGLWVSDLALGTQPYGTAVASADVPRLVEAFLDAGGNLVDTANAYGRGASESALAPVLRQHRHRIVLATKVRGAMGDGPLNQGLSRRHILDQLDQSLKRLQTDYIDLYQIHRWDDSTPIEETLRAMDDAVRAGKVRYIGASNCSGWQMATAIETSKRLGLAKWVSIQPQYSLLCRDGEREVLPYAREAGLGVIPWSPLAGGVLAGRYRPGQPPPEGSRGAAAVAMGGPFARAFLARTTETALEVVEEVRRVADGLGKPILAVALRWVMDQPGVTAPIIGPRTVEQLNGNLEATGWRLPDDARAELDRISQIELGYPYA